MCPPPPDANAYTAQRTYFAKHFEKIHPAYTFLDGNAAAALNNKDMGSYLVPKAPAAGARAVTLKSRTNQIIFLAYVCKDVDFSSLYPLNNEFCHVISTTCRSIAAFGARPCVAYCRHACFIIILYKTCLFVFFFAFCI